MMNVFERWVSIAVYANWKRGIEIDSPEYLKKCKRFLRNAIYGRNTDEMDGSQFSGNLEARKETFDAIAGSFQLLNEKISLLTIER